MKHKRTLAFLLALTLNMATLSVLASAKTDTDEQSINIQENIYETILPEQEVADNSILFADYVNRAFYPDRSISLFGVSARETLDDADKVLYDNLKSNIEGVAAGQSASTTFTLSGTTFSQNGIKTEWTNAELGVDSITGNDVGDAFYEQFDFSRSSECSII